MYTCRTCGETDLGYYGGGHRWDEGTVITANICTQDGVCRYTCTVCSYTYERAISATGHTWDEGTVISQLTCTQNGVQRYTCTACGDTYDEATTAPGHQFQRGVWLLWAWVHKTLKERRTTIKGTYLLTVDREGKEQFIEKEDPT